MRLSNSDQKGRGAETLAAWYLRCKGYRILTSRFKTPVGEVDLIARRGRDIVFVEVKFRSSLDGGAEAVHAKTRARVRAAAELYLQRHPEYTHLGCRFDALVMAPYTWPRHIQNAW